MTDQFQTSVSSHTARKNNNTRKMKDLRYLGQEEEKGENVMWFSWYQIPNKKCVHLCTHTQRSGFDPTQTYFLQENIILQVLQEKTILVFLF